MEQVIKCTNDVNKNAVRLCDDCNLPFCAECLRKNFFGFYYCQNCFPALFKDASVPEYEIPIDEKGLMKLQSKIQDEVIQSHQDEVENDVILNRTQIIRQTFIGGVCGLVFSSIIWYFFPNIGLYLSVILTILGLVIGFHVNESSDNLNNGAIYGCILSVIYIIYEFITFRGDSSNFGFILIIVPMITILGILLGSIISIVLYIISEIYKQKRQKTIL